MGYPEKSICSAVTRCGKRFMPGREKSILGSQERLRPNTRSRSASRAADSAARRLLMPALVAGTVLASLVLLGLVYPRFWPDWVDNHIVASGEVAEAPLDPIEIVERAQAARHCKNDSATSPERPTFPTPEPVELRALIDRRAAGPAAIKVDLTGPATAPEMRTALSAPAAATLTAGIQIPTGVTAAPAAKSISVRTRELSNAGKILWSDKRLLRSSIVIRTPRPCIRLLLTSRSKKRYQGN